MAIDGVNINRAAGPATGAVDIKPWRAIATVAHRPCASFVWAALTRYVAYCPFSFHSLLAGYRKIAKSEGKFTPGPQCIARTAQAHAAL
jgi:hypothetical protein